MKKLSQSLLKISLMLMPFCFASLKLNAQTIIDISGVGTYHLHPTQYGAFLSLGDTISGSLAFVSDGNGKLSAGCDEITQDIQGKIAVLNYDLMDDNDCLSSYDKVNNAMAAGAKAVILVINDPNSQFPSNFGVSDYVDMIPTYVVLLDDFTEVLYSQENIDNVNIYYYYEDNETVLWSEDFGNGFNSDNGLWTSVGITNDTSVWVYQADAQSKGWIRHFLIDSPTKGNGAALLDTDYYITKGATQAPPPDFPYGDVGAELISPIIDLSEAGPINLKWYQYCIGLNSEADSYIGLYYSLDGGANWSPRINLNTENIFNANTTNLNNPEIQRVFIDEAAGVSEFRFKIEFRSDLYAMLVDDIQVTEAARTNLTISEEPFYTPANYMQPTYSIEHDEFFFNVMVQNNGSEPQGNITLKVEFINLDNNSVVKTIEGESNQIIPVGEIEEVSITETYKPADLPAGRYMLRYTVIPEEADAYPDDNISEIHFEVSDNSFSQTNLNPTVNSWYNSNGNLVGVGNVYTIPEAVNENYQVGNVKVSYINSGGGAIDASHLSILITEVPSSIDEEWTNWDFGWPEDPFNLEAIHQIAYQEIPLAGTSEGQLLVANGDSFIDAETFNRKEKVILQNGTRYIVWNTVQDDSVALGLSADYPIINPPAPFIYDGGEQRYYTYFTNGVQAVIILELQLVSRIDNNPLPDKAMNIYPNPTAQDILYANIELKASTDATITIADMNGIVKSINTHKSIQQQTIECDISTFTPGIYIIRLATKDGTKTTKFIKQ